MQTGCKTGPEAAAASATFAAVALTVSTLTLHQLIPWLDSEGWIPLPAFPESWYVGLALAWALELFASSTSGMVVSAVAFFRVASLHVDARRAGRKRILLLVCLAGCAFYNFLAAGFPVLLVLIRVFGTRCP